MKLAITGRQGQLATCLLEAAARQNRWQVRQFGRPEFDLSKIETIGQALEAAKPDFVVNAAAYTAVDKAESDADAALLINGAAAGAVADACARLDIPMLQVSTDFVFDGTCQRPYVETDPTSPINVYGASKLLGEQLVRSAAPRHLIFRTSWVISPFGQNFAKTMLRLGAERERLSVIDDQRGAPTYAPHLADAILDAAAVMARVPAGDNRWGTYHVASQGETTWCGLARAIFAEAARHGAKVPEIVAIPTSGYPTPARRPANSRLNCDKLKSAFGIALPPWQDGVRLCVDRLIGQPRAA